MLSQTLCLDLLLPLALGLAVCLPGCASRGKSGLPDETEAGCRFSESLQAGRLPEGWKVDATNPRGAPAKWEVVSAEKAGVIKNLLAITAIADDSKDHFNLYWTDRIRMKNCVISASICANTGKIDQGGGLIWRVQNADNYYIARYNPLENNFRLYCVKNGKRVRLAGADGIAIRTGQWFKIEIAVNGDKIEARLNDRKLAELTDTTLPEAGGVGLWSKADAASAFDEFTCRAQ